MENALQPYYDALERLKNGLPKVVVKGTKITNDSVSIEAGRSKGSIKKSRPTFLSLIAAIKAAAEIQSSPTEKAKSTLHKLENESQHYQELYELQLSECGSFLLEIYRLQSVIKELEARCDFQKSELEKYIEISVQLKAELAKSKSLKPHLVPQ